MKSLFSSNARARRRLFLLLRQNPSGTPSPSPPLHRSLVFYSSSSALSCTAFRGGRGLACATASACGVSETTKKTPLSPSPPLLRGLIRRAHSLQLLQKEEKEGRRRGEEAGEEEDSTMNEFLSRFVSVMRGKLCDVYPDCSKDTINSMLAVIVQKVVAELEKGSIEHMITDASSTALAMGGIQSHDDLSLDLWTTVWEASNLILEDMRKTRKREEMKKCLQAEDVKAMCQFARDVGVRGDMLREMRLKWGEEKFSEREFYRSLERLKAESDAASTRLIESPANAGDGSGDVDGIGHSGADGGEEGSSPSVVLPQRRGKIKYRIYGLDMSDPKWGDVAERLSQAEKVIVPEEPKMITGKCKLVTQKILSLSENEDPSALLAEWAELLEPGKVDWLALLDKLKERNPVLSFKVAEELLSEQSFMADIRDYFKLIDGHAKENRVEDAERILQKMIAKGITPDILTQTVLVHMYSKAGNLERAKAAFDDIRNHGFRPDAKAYNSMILAYVNDGQPKAGEALMREMEARDIKPTKEIYMELLRSFAQRGHVDGAQRIVNTMQFAGYQPDLESCTLLVEAYGQAGDPDQARNNFDFMIKAGHKPDDRCTASMIAAYEKKNLLDKALALLLDLEKNGLELGVSTYTVLVDWLGKLQLVDEAEQALNKIAEKGKAPFKINISLCDMYARAGIKKKALEALGIIESKLESLRVDEFERIIHGLLAGGLVSDAKRIHEIMQKQGHPSSEPIKVALMTAQVIPRQKSGTR
ncbi:Pentatricopeptide repeat-containing protein [Nymphaea thermarum]|nr:Pentatricopeptide repeat-containing protein [Nymphaea thermarum]